MTTFHELPAGWDPVPGGRFLCEPHREEAATALALDLPASEGSWAQGQLTLKDNESFPRAILTVEGCVDRARTGPFGQGLAANATVDVAALEGQDRLFSFSLPFSSAQPVPGRGSVEGALDRTYPQSLPPALRTTCMPLRHCVRVARLVSPHPL